MSMVPGVAEARKEAERIRPVEMIAYPDKVQVWLKTALSQTRIEWLRARCGNGLHVELGRKRWDVRRDYNQRLQLHRPNREALQWLCTQAGNLMNYLELAIDWTFNYQHERDEAHEFVRKYHVQRWHGEQKVTFVKGTRYTGERRTPNKLVCYADLHSRITGEIYCVHLEWRLNGVQALRRAGIATVAELLKLDVHEFWNERLIMRAVDCGALGRQYHIHVSGKPRRRGAWIEYDDSSKRGSYNFDTMAGGILVMKRGSTQALVDEFRKSFDVGRCLRKIDVAQLLPKQWDMSRQETFRKKRGSSRTRSTRSGAQRKADADRHGFNRPAFS